MPFKEPTRAIVINVPESKLAEMKKYLESSGHHKYVIHDVAPFFRDMIQYQIVNGIDAELGWEDTLSMEPFVAMGAAVLIGPRTEGPNALPEFSTDAPKKWDDKTTQG